MSCEPPKSAFHKVGGSPTSFSCSAPKSAAARRKIQIGLGVGLGLGISLIVVICAISCCKAEKAKQAARAKGLAQQELDDLDPPGYSSDPVPPEYSSPPGTARVSENIKYTCYS